MLGRTLVDVWIKITRTTIVTSMPIIASFSDAWIKTTEKYLLSELLFSRTLGVCGLKSFVL